MKCSEISFRNYYHHFCIFPMAGSIKDSAKSFPGSDRAEYALTYGYIDHEAGLTFEIIACAMKKGDIFGFAPSLKDTRALLRYESVMDMDVILVEEDKLAEMFADKVESLLRYSKDKNIEKTRQLLYLDECRDKKYIDDVLVYLICDGRTPEGVWVRIEKKSGELFKGTLLNEPNQAFGVHEGDSIRFSAQKNDEDKVICFTDLRPE